MNPFKELFLLDPDIIYLNHGSFGACPRAVFEVFQDWQRQLEYQPVDFIGRRLTGLLAEARARLSEYLGVTTDEVVYFQNPTTAINMVARSLSLKPGDEILATDHEYGSLDRTWNFVCQKSGAKYIRYPIPLPLSNVPDFIEAFWSGVNERTKVIFISHITSPTALIFPIAEICQKARQAGILSIVDGAHAPGQIIINLPAIGADIYTGACHKWLCAPKGSAFLFARREIQTMLEPLVISWGFQSKHPGPSQFIDYHEVQGTRDVAAFLSVPKAIELLSQPDWVAARQDRHNLACQTRQRISELTHLDPISPLVDNTLAQEHTWFGLMFVARLPNNCDLEYLKRRLYDDFHIEVPLTLWNDQKLIRTSFQVYNSEEDADRLLEALSIILR